MIITSADPGDLLYQMKRQIKPQQDTRVTIRFDVRVGFFSREAFEDIVCYVHLLGCTCEIIKLSGWLTKHYLVRLDGLWSSVSLVLRRLEEES